MKKSLPAIILAALAGIAIAQYYAPTEHGSVVTVTTTPQSFTPPAGVTANAVKINVRGGGRVFAQNNISTNNFVATNAVPVESYPPETLGIPGSAAHITNVVMSCSSGTEEVFLIWKP